MLYKKLILDIAKKNNGTVTSAQVTQEGISRYYLTLLTEKGLLERSERGVYIMPDNLDDEIFNLQIRYKRGIFSHGTALYLLDLTDRTPDKYTLTFPSGYHAATLKNENIKYYRVKKEFYSIGIKEGSSPGGNKIRLYNAERTLCDIIRWRRHVDIQMVTDAFKRYVTMKNQDLYLLSSYARIFRVEKIIRSYMEVLL